MTQSYRIISLSEEFLKEAEARADELPVYRGSHRGRNANIVGSIGELAFERFLKDNDLSFTDFTDKTRLDYMINGLSVDVKTKDRSVLPKRHYDNSVPAYNHEHQRPDYFYFVSLHRTGVAQFKSACMMGGIDIETLDRIGTKWAKGDVDPSNNMKFWTDTINIRNEQLYSNAEMLQIFRREYD